MSALLPQLLVATALAIEPGGSVTVAGAVESTYDGARIDAAAMFDPEAGGLRVVESSGARLKMVPAGVGPMCTALGLSSPCLVPRLTEHAHARLLEVDAFRGTLRGGFDVAIEAPPVPPSNAPALFRVVAFLGLAGALVAAVMSLFSRRRATPLGKVEAAARSARRAVAGDPTLVSVREEIDRLVAHAHEVDRLRAQYQAALVRARTVRDRLAVEHEEERRLELDLSRARARLTEIAAALRLVPLRVREAARFGQSPIESIVGELTLRETILAELEPDAR
jgi:hypothetical protein